MVDLRTVCCLCGDVGFSDKLFRCSKCLTRFQHSYCSNYNCREYAEPAVLQVCDWCRCDERDYNISLSKNNNNSDIRSAYSGERIKQHTPEKSTGKIPSPRPSARRYKLLKDVMCSTR
ncbi:hypothetical protein ABFS83_14G148200 [Erythranthe nasuta]